MVENKDSPEVVTTIPQGTAIIGVLHQLRDTTGVRSDVINRPVSNSRRGTNSGSAGHKGDELDDDEMEGLMRLEVAFGDLTYGGGQGSGRQSHRNDDANS